MNSAKPTKSKLQKLAYCYMAALSSIAITICILHINFFELKRKGVYWFNLDKERNLPTWFSGTLFCMLGIAALLAYYWENKQNEKEKVFRLPSLWLGIAVAGFFLSLDEMTILHENILWREVRANSEQFGEFWFFFTQWQIVFAPLLLLMLCYFILFFYNRFHCSRASLITAFLGVGSLVMAVSLEGLRGLFKTWESSWYANEVIAEEFLEMMGPLLICSSIVFYTIDIALDFNEERKTKVLNAARIINKKSMFLITITCLFLMGVAGILFLAAKQQQELKADIPKLFRDAKKLPKKTK